MTESERQQMLTEARIYALAEPMLTPMLEKMKKETFQRLLSEHRQGNKDYSNLVAELNVITKLEMEINSKIQTYNTMEGLANGSNNRK
jgi:hypothetical protein